MMYLFNMREFDAVRNVTSDTKNTRKQFSDEIVSAQSY